MRIRRLKKWRFFFFFVCQLAADQGSETAAGVIDIMMQILQVLGKECYSRQFPLHIMFSCLM